MKKSLYTLLLIVSASGISGSSTIQENTLTEAEQIEVGPGPEDMVLDTLNGDPRLLISCTGRREIHQPYGEIEALSLESGDRTIMQRTAEPEGILFRPHGICLDRNTLYVISHEKEPDYHPVLIYRIHGDTLVFEDLVSTPLQHSPNALVTGPDREIYLVNDSGKRGSMLEKILKLRRASVVRLQKGSNGEWDAKILAERLGYPAGINRMGSRLFVGDAILHRIHVFEISGQGLDNTGQIRDVKGNDNIRVYGQKLVTPGHIKPFRFIRHAKKKDALSPVEVFLLDPEKAERTSLFITDGSLISAGSTALIHDGYLYICQVFDPFILKVSLP